MQAEIEHEDEGGDADPQEVHEQEGDAHERDLASVALVGGERLAECCGLAVLAAAADFIEADGEHGSHDEEAGGEWQHEVEVAE